MMKKQTFFPMVTFSFFFSIFFNFFQFFSLGIIMCELIGRVDADPDVLPRTENFGLDYIAFSAMCPSCPPDFLKLTYNCVKVRILPQNLLFLSFKDTSMV